MKEHHSDLPRLGLQLRELNGDAIDAATAFREQYRGVSTYDCLALALAVNINCRLLTGDARQARDAFDRMQKHGRRLPWRDVDALIQRHQ